MSVIDRTVERGVVPERYNAAAACLAAAAITPDKTAIAVVEARPSTHAACDPLSFSALALQTGGVAEAVRAEVARSAANGAAGSVVAIATPDPRAAATSLLGVWAAGGVAAPLSTGLTASEFAYILRDADAALLICDPDLDAAVEGARRAGVARVTPTCDAVAPLICADTASDAPALMVYTSGSTGRPKGVLHAHRALWARGAMREGWTGLRAADRVLHAGAFNWTYSLGVGLFDPLAVGATALMLDRPERLAAEPGLWPAVLAASRATVFAATPAHYRRVLKYADHWPPTRLRACLSAGEKLSDDLRAAWREQTAVEVYEAFGCSECSTFISYSEAALPRVGGVGRAQPGRKVAVLGLDDDAPTPLGAAGRLAVATDDPGFMLGYWRGPGLGASPVKGAWFATGDAARIAASGDVEHLGRVDEQMNAMGHRVSPEEVEAALSGVDGVADVAAAEVRVAADVAVIAVFIQPVDAAVWADLEARLRAMAETALARYKRPKLFIEARDGLRTRTGKLRRRALGREESDRRLAGGAQPVGGAGACASTIE